MCSCNVLGNNKQEVESWGLLQSGNGSTSVQAWLGGWADCLSQLSALHRLWFVLREQRDRRSSTGCQACSSHPSLFTPVHTLVVSVSTEQGSESPELVRSLWEGPISTPWPRCPIPVSEHSLQLGKPVWGQDGSLEHDLWWCSWRIFLVLTKPCEIVASYLCSFFLKWNAQWWCQWLNNHILWLRVQVSLQNKCKC